MDEKSYNILLTILLVVIGTAILVGGGIIIKMTLDDKETEKNAEEIIEMVESSTIKKTQESEGEKKESVGKIDPSAFKEGERTGTSEVSGSKIKDIKMENYAVIGVLKIPKIKLEYPILEQLTKRSLEIALAQLNTQRGINNPGNTTILGHNYKNNLFFSKLHLLQNGDKIIVTDINGRVVEYEVYETAKRKPSDTTYISRDTEGRREISLSTCNDDSTLRHVVLAREVE